MSDLILLTVPIGDKKDITLNVLERLKIGKYFAVEDTRPFKNLLKSYEIDLSDKIIFSFHDQSESSSLKKAINILDSGDCLYFVSDAGSPIISDPAFPLVLEAKKRGHCVKSFSGISSIVKALELSTAYPCPFTFHGFFPRDRNKRLATFEDLSRLGGTHIFFESPRRVKPVLELLRELEDADRLLPTKIVVCRELTKTYEEVIVFDKNNLEDKLDELTCLGEFVLIFQYEGLKGENVVDQEVINIANNILEKGAGTKQVSRLLSKLLNISTKDIYNRLNSSG